MFSFAKKRGPTLGLDINSDSTTLFQLDRTKVGLEITRFAKQPTPPNAVHEGLITDPDTVGAIVREILDELGFPASGPAPVLNVAVPGQSVVIRLMPVPVGMPPEELADVVTQEAINHVPFPMAEANLDWAVMSATERTDGDGVRRVDVIIAAMQKGIVDAYWRMTDVAGVKLGKLDMSSLALIRGLSFAGYLQEDDRLLMTVNVRQDATDINLVRKGMPLFTRSVLLGIETLGEALCRSLDVSLSEARALLPQIPLFGMAPVDAKIGQAAQIARTVFGDIIDEVGRSLEFYRSQVGEVHIDGIILCGPGCRIPQVDQFVSNRLNIGAEIADPLREILYDANLILEGQHADLTMTLGTLIEPGSIPMQTVDLDLNKDGPSAAVMEGIEERPTVRVLEEETPWFAPALGAGVALLVILCGVWAYLSQFDAPKKTAELSSLSTQISQQKKQLEGLASLKTENDVLLRKKNLLAGIVKHGQQFAAVLEAIKDDTPEGLQISKVTINNNTVELEGNAVDFATISDLTLNLSGSGLIKDTSVASAKRDIDKDPRVINFEVSAVLRPNDGRQLAVSSIAPPAAPGGGSGFNIIDKIKGQAGAGSGPHF